MKHCFEFMEFAASVSERDPGVKVIDFEMKLDSSQNVQGNQIIANLTKLVADLKTASNGQFRFNLKASNGQVILTSELYTEKRGALNGIESVKRNAPINERYERKANKNGEPYFVLKASNGQVVGQSETYSSTAAMEGGIESVKKNAPDAAIDDLTGG